MKVLDSAPVTSRITERRVTIAEPEQVLHRQRPVEAVGMLDLRHHVLGRVGGQDGLQRVARREVDQREAHHADAERDGDCQQDAAGDVA
jgi:hypothetical protein